MDFKKNKEIIAWSLYDFANQPFTTLIVTFIFSKFFVEVLAKNEIAGTSLWSLGISITAIFVSLLSPILGALADAGGYRKLFLIISTYVCVFATIILYFFEPDQIYLIGGCQIHVSIISLCLFIIANIGFEFGTVFCNSYLTDLSDNQNIGKISGYAWGLGFVGGLLSLALSLVLFDVSDNINNVRYINLLVAFWLIVFSLPTFIYLKDQKPRKGFKRHVKSSINAIVTTFKNISQHQSIVKFLIARLFYNDALVTIFAFGGVYAGHLGFSFLEVLILGVVLNIAACIGSFLFGYLEDKIGVFRMLNITLWVLLFSVLLAFIAPFFDCSKLICLPPSLQNIINPKVLFWIAGFFIGLMQGPNQSGSRSLMARLTPDDKKNEFFGFYAFSGKATSFIGPLLFGVLTAAFGTQQAGLLIVVVFFILGILFFRSLRLTV
ncbi:MAG: MFS transporter [Flavobacteriales bacterium]|nr:MFS transporter [Flavobacteriales bacterium]|tara:strand:- start:7020 stop:8327 length:1308 start_codon:yes stop_codon:yes gene_type:complete